VAFCPFTLTSVVCAKVIARVTFPSVSMTVPGVTLE
jgi:hypothetical protein